MTNRRSPAWRLLILMIGAVALLGLVAAACGDDDDGGNDNGNGDATATDDAGGFGAGNGDSNGNGDGDGDGDGGGDGDGDGGGDGDDSSLADLAGFGDDYESFEGKVTYNITGFTAEGGLGSMSIYQKGTSSRFDITSDDGEVIFISTPDATYLCTEGQCLQYPADDDTASAGVASLASIFSADTISEGIDDIPAGVDVDVTSETIAGVDATCFSATGDLDPNQAGNESSEFCFSDGGLLLRLAFEGADESGSFVATAASDDVPDSDFDPPYDVFDLGDLGDFQP